MIWDMGCDGIRVEVFGELKICVLYLYWVDGSFWRWEFFIVWLVFGGKIVYRVNCFIGGLDLGLELGEEDWNDGILKGNWFGNFSWGVNIFRMMGNCIGRDFEK